MLHRGGCITDSKCYDVCHIYTEKICSPSLLATIMQYSEMKSDKFTRYRNKNDPAGRKYFVETQDARHEKLIVNVTGVKFYMQYPPLVSLDGIITCSCHAIRRLEINCPYNYQKRLVKWDKDRTFHLDRSNSIKKDRPNYSKCSCKCLYYM